MNEPAVDGLPEQMHYADTGCEASMSCLECPLPRCKFDDPAWYQAYKLRERDEEIAWVYQYENLHIFEVADPVRHQRAYGAPRAAPRYRRPWLLRPDRTPLLIRSVPPEATPEREGPVQRVYRPLSFSQG